MDARIRKMAEAAGISIVSSSDGAILFGGSTRTLEAFARLVAEDCAKEAIGAGRPCAATAIRARYAPTGDRNAKSQPI